jgi:hypothetical protein
MVNCRQKYPRVLEIRQFIDRSALWGWHQDFGQRLGFFLMRFKIYRVTKCRFHQVFLANPKARPFVVYGRPGSNGDVPVSARVHLRRHQLYGLLKKSCSGLAILPFLIVTVSRVASSLTKTTLPLPFFTLPVLVPRLSNDSQV